MTMGMISLGQQHQHQRKRMVSIPIQVKTNCYDSQSSRNNKKKTRRNQLIGQQRRRRRVPFHDCHFQRLLLLTFLFLGLSSFERQQQSSLSCLRNIRSGIVMVEAVPSSVPSDYEERKRKRKERREREKQQQKQQYEKEWRQHEEQKYGKNGDDGSGENPFENMDPRGAFQSIFPYQPPRDVIQGTINAVKSTLIGVSIAGVSFFSVPIIGFTQSGWGGLLIGGIAGTIGASITLVVSIANAAFQLVLGLLKTPLALFSVYQEKVWDKDTHEWEYYSLQQESGDLSSGTSRSGGGGKVRDDEYYNLLGVSSNASSKEIKRAYYTKARDVHPDKNPDDEQAAEKFRKLHVAYQVLSDSDKRASYDKWGSSSINENSMGSGGGGADFDPYFFFQILFGSQSIEPYIGELNLAQVIDNISKLSQMNGNTPSLQDVMNLFGDDTKLRKRQVEIAQNLLARTEAYVNGAQTSDEFRATCTTEAQEIGESPFGPNFLRTIGSTLVLEAKLHLGFRRSLLGVKGPFVWINRARKGALATLDTLRKTWKVIKLSFVDQETEEKSSSSSKNNMSDKFKLNLQHILPEIMELTFAYNNQDITSALKGACWRLFADEARTLEKKQRQRKAEAILILGQEFVKQGNIIDSVDDSSSKKKNNASKTCKDEKVETEDIIARANVAFKLSTLKASGQETPDNSEHLIDREKMRARMEEDRKAQKEERQKARRTTS